MSTVHVSRRTAPLIDLVVPRSLLADVVLVGGGALLTALAAQIVVPLQPVPFTLQTFSVLLVGAALGSLRGALSMLVYLAAGVIGLPVFASASGGAHVVFGATGGYLVGFVLAAWIVGFIAERGGGRILPTVGALLAGSATVYLVGVPWLAVALGMPLSVAVGVGLAPFLVGDLIKLAAAAMLLPGAWAVIARLTGKAGR
ncbi:biotin transporter BioY [Microbacterium rhizosphaerae]|uniref:Biotin transporter n=1 Tax=Microbacterium rhizosphaerae TaxID=1678237 RepID=A0ABZ0SIK7_9MICO|nr:biotin transporter BioY [Microbacterium rhizosphaerae]WPR88883.1 biotin transporter BioY [Microbacterium rhizosphaerae]